MFKPTQKVAQRLGANGAVVKGIVFILAVTTIATERAFAQSLANSSWPIFRRNASLQAYAPVHAPVFPTIKWIANIGSGQVGSPTVATDGTIYVPGNVDSAFYAIAPNGQLQWIFAGKPGEHFVASPVLGNDGTLYLGSTDSVFYAFNPNGTMRWSKPLGGAVNFSANIGSNGTIYVVASDCFIYAISPNAEILWKVNLERQPANGPAIADDGTIYVVARELLKGFNADGTLKLVYSTADIDELNGLMTQGGEIVYVTTRNKTGLRRFSGTPPSQRDYFLSDNLGGATLPALVKNGTIYFAAKKNGVIVALTNDMSRRWTFSRSGTKNISELIVDDSSHVYIVNDQLGLISVSAAGKLRWSLPEVRCEFSPAFGGDGTIYVPSNGKLYAVGRPAKATSLTKISGDLQTACIGTSLPLPIKVQIKDQDGNPFPNHPVNFRVLSGGGTVNPPLASTDNNGFAQATWTLGNQPGQQQLEASSNGENGPLTGSPIIFTATGSTPRIAGNLQVVFDSTEVKLVSERFYVIRNNSECVLRIDSARVIDGPPPSFFLRTTAFPILIVPGQSDSLRLQYAPQDCGSHNGTLRIFSNDPTQQPFDVTLRGAALSRPDIEVAGPLNFDPICRGSSDTLSLPIFNLGCAALQITNLTLSNPAFRVVASLPIAIPPSSQATVQVIFSPAEAITYNGVLTITSNDPDESARTVNLTGNGGASDIALTAPPFGNVCTGQRASTQVCIINPSDCELLVDSTAILFISSALAQATQRLPSSFQGQPLVIAPKDSFCFAVSVVPRSPGNFTVEVTVWSNAAGKSPIKTVIPGTAGSPDIAGVPAEVIFPQVEAQTCAGNLSATRQAVTLRNDGACALRIDSLRTTGVFSVVSPSVPQIVVAGGSLEITLQFAPNDTGTFNGTLRIFSDDPDESPVSVALVGKAIAAPDIAVNPLEIDFGQVPVGRNGIREISIRNLGAVRLKVDSLVSSSTVFTSDAGEFVLDCNKDSSVTVAFMPTAVGLFEGTLSIFSNDPNEDPVLVKLRGTGVDSGIIFEPAALDFGAVCGPVDAIITISNLGQTPVPIDTLRFSNAAFSTTQTVPFTIPASGSARITIRYSPAPGRNDTGTLTIASQNPAFNKLVVPLKGQGGVPDIDGVAQVNLNPVPLNCAGPKNFADTTYVILNVGDCDLRIDSLLTNFPFSVLSPPVPQTIPKGSSLGVRLRFTPDSARVYAGVLRIKSNDPDEPSTFIDLRGAGVSVPDIAVAPLEIDFGNVPIGSSKSLDLLRIKNEGRQTLRVDSLVISCPQFTTEAKEFVLRNCSDDTAVIVAFKPTSPGPIQCTLKIFSNDPDISENPVVVILKANGAAPSISANPLQHDFGILCNKDSLTVVIASRGQTPLQVDSLVFSNPAFFTRHAQSFLVAENDSEKVIVYFAPVAGRPDSGTLSIYSNDKTNSPVVVNLNGAGGAPMIAGRRSIDFGIVPVGCTGGNSSTQTYVFRNIGPCDLVIDTAFTAGDFAIIAGGGQEILRPGDSTNIVLQFTPSSPTPKTGTLTIVSNDPDEREFGISLSGRGLAAPDIAVDSLLLDFGLVAVDSVKRLPFKVSNEGALQLVLNRFVSSCPQFTTEASEFALDCSKQDSTVMVAFKPTAAGLIECTLSIYSNDPDSNENPLVVTLRGNGATGNLQACQSTPATPSLCLGDSAKIEYRLCNVGKAALKIDSVKLAVRADFRNARIVSLHNRLEPDSAIAITVTFAPRQAGSWSDTLLVYANLPPKTILHIPLKGESRDDPGQLAVRDRLLDFSTYLDLFERKFVHISNEGCQPLKIDSAKVVERRFRGIFWVDPQFRLPIELAGQKAIDVPVYFKGRDFRTFVDSLYVYSSAVDVASSHVYRNNSQAASSRVDTIRLIGKVPDGAACLEVSPERLDFGQWPVGQSKILSLTLNNCSPDSLLSRMRVRAIKPPRGEFFASPETLWVFPRNAQSIFVKFSPLRQGESLDTLTLVFHTLDSPRDIFVWKVPLRGFGTGRLVYALPNAFTPNGDDKNDRAKIRFAGYDSSQVTLRVFDLRGIEVRSLTAEFVERDATGFYVPWDGLNGGKELQMPGTYLWMLEEKGKRAGSGQIVLIR